MVLQGGVLSIRGLTTRGSYNQGSYNQGFLNQGSCNDGFLQLGALQPGVFRTRLRRAGTREPWERGWFVICVSFEDMSTLYRVAFYADVKDTPFGDLFLKKPGIFLARNQKPFNYTLIVAQFLAHKPVNFVSLIF